jgi:serine/threonine-protein kinase
VVPAVVNPEAFELYLQGRQAWNLRSPEGFARAEQLLNRAIAIAPGFSRAQGALGDVAMMRDEDAGKLGAFGQRNSSELADLIAQIQRVLALDPDLADAHASLGNAHTLGWKFAEGEQSFRRAIALNPNYATAHQWLAFPLFFAGWVDEALAEQQHAVELDPLSPRILDNLGHGLRRVGRYREALAAFDRALSLQPSWPEALGGKALTCVALGRFAEAVALARQLPADNPVTAGFQISIFGQAGLRAEAEALLAQWTPAGNWSRIQLLLATGRQEEALAALDASEERLYPEHSDVLLDPLFDPIRDDPRFVKFIATLGWTAAHARSQAWRKAHPPEKPEAAGQRTADGKQKSGKTSGGGQ